MARFDLEFDIHRFKEAPSTNAVAKDLARQGAGEGIAVIAETQTSGKGRGKNAWHSPRGGLYCSVLLQASEPRRVTDISILAGVAVCQAVRDSLPKSCDVSVKWPNDCLINFKKVGGILCETVDESGLCVVGIGLNINTKVEDLVQFQSNAFKATSFIGEIGAGTFDMEKVFQTLLKKIAGVYGVYRKDGFEPIRFAWEKCCHLIGKKVEFTENNQKQSGTFLGIDPSGAMLLASTAGEKTRLLSGEITCFWP